MIFKFLFFSKESLRKMNEMPTKCLSLENGNFLSEDEIEAFELSNPDIVETTAWRIRKHLWACVFGVRLFFRTVRENVGDLQFEFNVLETLLNNRVAQIKTLTKYHESTYNCYHPFIMLITNLSSLLPMLCFVFTSQQEEIYRLRSELDFELDERE